MSAKVYKKTIKKPPVKSENDFVPMIFGCKNINILKFNIL